MLGLVYYLFHLHVESYRTHRNQPISQKTYMNSLENWLPKNYRRKNEEEVKREMELGRSIQPPLA